MKYESEEGVETSLKVIEAAVLSTTPDFTEDESRDMQY